MRRFIGLSICAVLAFGCGDDDGTPDATSGPDAQIQFDVGTNPDGGPGGDTGPVFDGGADFDSGPVFDGGPDFDGGPVVSPDAGPSGSCSTYDEACLPDRGCIQPGFSCQAENPFVEGDAMDPIMGAPAGMESYPGAFFAGGMCTPQVITDVADASACDPDDDEDTTCGDCGSCTDLGGVVMCLRDCEASVTDNGDCRDFYSCSLTDSVCLPIGCHNDTGCRVAREETNGIPGIQTPNDCTARSGAACGGVTTNFDALVYDATSEAVCNTDTYVCEGGPSSDTSGGGDMCTGDEMCEAGGRCILESASCSNRTVTGQTVDCTTDAHCTAAIVGSAANGTCGEPSWVGGACIKLGCEVAGNECTNGGVCQERGLGVSLCLDGCTMGAGADPAVPATWSNPTTGAGGCRTGYNCFWNGVDTQGVANNGVCVPGGFNDVAEANTGAQCSDESDCWSPLGRSRCLRFAEADEFGYCTVSDCTSPDFPVVDPPVTVCGADTCINFGDAEEPFGLCLENCTTATDCSTTTGNIGCVQLTMGEQKHCFPGCQTTEDCRAGLTCTGATATALGDCM